MGHFVADYPLQTDFIAKHKGRSNSLEAVPWYYVLFGHAATHAFFVGIITQNVWLGIAELIAHFIIDFAKCEKYFSIHVDQAFHILCKVIWFIILLEL